MSMIHPACKMCKGACCELIHEPIPPNKDHRELMLNKAVFVEQGIGRLFYRCGCSKLLNGLCKIYETRPKLCKDFAVGSIICRICVTNLRPKKAKAILDLM